MEDAFRTWDAADESLESIEARIHDGVPPDQLHHRAQGYARRIRAAAPWLSIGASAVVVEVGPGVGYIMQAFADLTELRRIAGLDVARNMMAHAQARLQRDGLSPDRFAFHHYDGVTFPFADESVDLFYSVAAIQHIPKPFAYNVLIEMHRCLVPGGTAVVHLLDWSFVAMHSFSLADEIRRQVSGAITHWHHFYDEIEIRAIIEHTLKSPSIRIATDGGSMWVAWRK